MLIIDLQYFIRVTSSLAPLPLLVAIISLPAWNDSLDIIVFGIQTYGADKTNTR